MRQRSLWAGLVAVALGSGLLAGPAAAQQGGSGPRPIEAAPAPPDLLFLPSPGDRPTQRTAPTGRVEPCAVKAEGAAPHQSPDLVAIPAPELTGTPPDLPPGPTFRAPASAARRDHEGSEVLPASEAVTAAAGDLKAEKPPAVRAAANPGKTPLSTPPGAQKPSLHIEKIGPTSVEVGKAIAYELVVRNAGTAVVFNVHVQDEIPAGARLVKTEPRAEVQSGLLGWDLGSLEPGTEQRFRVEVQPAGEGDFVSNAVATFSAACSLQTHVTQPRLVVAMTGPANVGLGEKAAFLIQVTNAGTAPATHVVLHDHLPAGLKHEQGEDIEAELGTIEPGAMKRVTLEATAARSGRHTNEATALGDRGQQAAAQTVVMVTEPLVVLRVSGPQRRFLERHVEFDLEVANTGSGAAGNVRVTDRVPAELEFVSAGQGGVYDPASRTVTWRISALAPGQHRGLKLRLLAKSPGNVVNRVAVTADRVAEVRGESAVRIEGIPAMVLEVSDQNDPVEAGTETTYEVRVINQGTCECTGVQIIAMVPEEMAAREATGPTAHRIQGQQVIFEPLPKVAAHSDVVYRVRVQARQPGDVRFKVQMTGEQLRTAVYEEEATRIYKD